MLELSQVQSNVLRGYRQGEAPSHVCYLFLQFKSAKAVRELLLELLPLVTTCASYDAALAGLEPLPGQTIECPTTTLNVGLAYPCLDLLGLGGNARALDERDTDATGAIEAFKCGMKARAAAILGDRGPSAPEQWEPAYRQELHAVLSLSGAQAGGLAQLRERVTAAIAGIAGAELVHEESGSQFEAPYTGKEHFGFADGIAQPEVLGSGIEGFPGDGTPNKRRGWSPVQAGEFVLGQIDESGKVQFGSPLFKHGSFMVFRKLRQHVGSFRDYTQTLAQRRGVSAELIGAKMIGRWPSGAPLVLSPRRDDAKLGADPDRNNDFRYADDPEGERCPFGAHIRRNNPREDPTGPLTPQTKLHRIIRRATPYGAWLPEGQADDGADRGTLFVVINANIARQFEFVQQNWVDGVLSSDRLTLPADRDPLIGSHTAGAKFMIPSSSRRKPPTMAWDLPNFVTTRGGAYFLLPSVDALYDIAHDVRWPNQEDPCGSGQPDEGETCRPDPSAAPEPEPETGPSPEPAPTSETAPSPETAPTSETAPSPETGPSPETAPPETAPPEAAPKPERAR